MSCDRHRPLKVRFLLGAAALLAGATSGAAQDLGGALDLGQLGADIGVNNAIRSHVARTRSGSRPAPERRPQANAGPFTYTPSIEQRRKNLARFVAASRRRDPQGAARLEAMFASQDVIGRINRELGAYGFRPNDVADAYAAWWINAWLASRGRTDDPTRGQIAAVRAQAAEAMMALPQMAGATDSVKQEMTEAYLVQTALIGAHLAQAGGKPAQLRQLAAAVRQGARAAGLDLDAMELSDAGFLPTASGAR